jgi:hypothetical protein
MHLSPSTSAAHEATSSPGNNMNKQTLLITFVLLLVITSGTTQVSAQGGDARLPGAKTTKPKPTPTPATKTVRDEPPAPPVTRAPASITPVAFNQLVTGGLDPQKSGQIKVGIYYDDFSVTLSEADLFTIFLQSANPALAVQLYEKEGKGLPTLRDPRSGEFKLDTPGGTVPKVGEYHVRVVGAVDPSIGPIGYTLRLNRTGLTEAGYQARLQAITAAFNSPDSKNIDDTISSLEKLTSDDGNQPGAWELLGVMYLYHKNDQAKAAAAMDKAIALKGAAVFRVTYDPLPGRRANKKPDGQYDFVDPKSGWLRIMPDRLMLVDAANEAAHVLNLSSSQIKEVTPSKMNTLSVILLKSVDQSRPYAFTPASKSQPEIDLILKTIRQHVPPRG